MSNLWKMGSINVTPVVLKLARVRHIDFIESDLE